MVAGVLAVVYFSGSTNPSSRTFMAKRDEFIKDKRYQNLLCAPSYKREIKELGNESRRKLCVILISRRFLCQICPQKSLFWRCSIALERASCRIERLSGIEMLFLITKTLASFYESRGYGKSICCKGRYCAGRGSQVRSRMLLATYVLSLLN